VADIVISSILTIEEITTPTQFSSASHLFTMENTAAVAVTTTVESYIVKCPTCRKPLKLSPNGEFTKHTKKEHPKWNKGIMKVIDKFEKRLAMEKWNEVDDDNDVLAKKEKKERKKSKQDDDDDDDTELQQTGKRIRPPLSSNKLRVSVFETNDVFTNVNDLNDPRIKEKWIQLTKFNVLYNTVKYLKIEHCQQKYPGWNALNMLKTVERSQR
jgi:hypothetical protein